MTQTRALGIYSGSDEGWAVFLPDTGPAFAGSARPGVDWGCAHCGCILLQNVLERQFLDILIRCPKCKSLCASIGRMPGEPVPVRTVLVPPGQYRLSSVVDVGNGALLLAGEPAIRNYMKETGARYGDLRHAVSSRIPSEINASALRLLAAHIVSLLGNGYQSLDATDRRGLKSHTPPVRRHRLVELVEFAQDAATRVESVAESARDLDGNALADLVTIASIFERWKHHPAYPRIVSFLQNADDVYHALMTLSVAGYLVDAGNGVAIVDDGGEHGRIPDIWIAASLLERLELEVKTPLALRAPAKLPSREVAIRIIETQLNNAASSRRGQLDPAKSGVVAVGAFHLGPGGLDRLEEATRAVLERQAARKRKPHVAAVLLCELSYDLTTEIDTGKVGQRTSFVPTRDHRLVYHAGYLGALTIAEGTPWSIFR